MSWPWVRRTRPSASSTRAIRPRPRTPVCSSSPRPRAPRSNGSGPTAACGLMRTVPVRRAPADIRPAVTPCSVPGGTPSPSSPPRRCPRA
ncbi:hypothetical protein ACFFX0_07580 [Citricoccus parietis]|uniref:Uncharacterized protein n=1 Tax=Citricoccus parietis TaxID=592307 RepID=A0ABV5FWI4_9MICC